MFALLITNRKSILPRQPAGPGGPKSGGGPPVPVSDAAVDVDDASDVELPELVLPLEPDLELAEEDKPGSGIDVGPTPKLDSAGVSGLQASADNTGSARGAIRRTRPS